MHIKDYATQPPARGKISVIIPVWRESAALSAALSVLCAAAEVKEVIVVFAEGDNAAMHSAEAAGAICVAAGEPNRGLQLDLGAEKASGDWLLFHHADTFITPAHLHSVATLHSDRSVVGGAFYRKFDERHPRLRWLEAVERWHNRSFGALYGDQSIFARRTIFRDLGGFRSLPLMEDVDFSLRLRRSGKIQLLDPPIQSSPRKHLTHGSWRTTFNNASLLLLYHLGADPGWLHAHYYRRGASSYRDPTDYVGESL